jgi:hypothetical protein
MSAAQEQEGLVSFFRGYTHDGCPFVITVVGDTASGIIEGPNQRIRIPDIPADQGFTLKDDLPRYDASEVVRALLTLN